MCREIAFLDKPAAFGATPEARGNSSGLRALLHAYNEPHPSHFRHPAVTTIYESKQTKLFTSPFFAPTAGTFEGFLLDRWFAGNNTYDALFVEQIPHALVCLLQLATVRDAWSQHPTVLKLIM